MQTMLLSQLQEDQLAKLNSCNSGRLRDETQKELSCQEPQELGNLCMCKWNGRAFFQRGSARGPEEQGTGLGRGSEHSLQDSWDCPPQMTLLLTSSPSLRMFSCRIWVQSHLQFSRVCPVHRYGSELGFWRTGCSRSMWSQFPAAGVTHRGFCTGVLLSPTKANAVCFTSLDRQSRCTEMFSKYKLGNHRRPESALLTHNYLTAQQFAMQVQSLGMLHDLDALQPSRGSSSSSSWHTPFYLLRTVLSLPKGT